MTSEITSKEQLKDLMRGKPWGEIKKLTPIMISNFIGRDEYNHILSVMSLELQVDHSQMLLCYADNVTHTPKCKCSKDLKFNNNKKCFSIYCSNECRFKYYDESLTNRRITNLEKYGHENVLASDYGKLKIKSTNISKYGFSSHTQTEEYKNKVKGKIMSTESIARVRESHQLNFYNLLPEKFPKFTAMFDVNQYVGVKSYHNYEWLCNTCNKIFFDHIDNGTSPICEHCNPIGSKHEMVTRNYLDSKNIKFIPNMIGMLPRGKEIDIYIPDKNVGIEMSGLRWHSTLNKSYTKDQHIIKHRECESIGIRLITVFDDEMFYKSKIVHNRIDSILGLVKRKIYARKCKIVNITSQFSRKFLDKYHIQGHIGGSYKYGLSYKGRIVSIMTFNKGRSVTGHSKKDGVYELGRYCTIAKFSVIGGAGKLFSHFIKSQNPEQVFTYSDNRWNTGEMYGRIGMTYVRDTQLNYWYTKDCKSRLHRVNFQKHKLKHMDSYDQNLTESEIMKLEKYYRIWDCGNKLFVWNKTNK